MLGPACEDYAYAIASELASENPNALPSLSWDEAAAQIGRWDATWSDDRVAAEGTETSVTVTYGYIANGADGEASPLSSAEIRNVEIALSQFSEIANIVFQRIADPESEYVSDEATTDLDILGIDNTNGGWMTGARQGSPLADVQIGLGERDLEDIGSWAFGTAIHEIGHAVGMAHPGDYNGAESDGKSYFEDSKQFTVMSYFDETDTGAQYGSGWYYDGGWERGPYVPTGLMLHDIAALQKMYGANMTTRTTDSTYGWNSNLDHAIWNVEDWREVPIAAIWDAGGKDTLDGSGWSMDQIIDLNEEAFSSFGGYAEGTALTNNVSIARGVKIENAIGGDGNDVIRGNNGDGRHVDAEQTGYNGANWLSGGGGDDEIFGGGGRDTLLGGAGSDFLDGGKGIDYLTGGEGADALDGGAAPDWAYYTNSDSGVTVSLTTGDGTGGHAEGDTLIRIEHLEGSAFDDSLTGKSGRNHLIGLDGDDQLIGMDGNDLLDGGAGADILDGGVGRDTATYESATAGVQIDMRLDVQAGGDAQGDVFFGIEAVTGSDYADQLTGDDGRNTLNGGHGDDMINGGFGRDILTGGLGADTFIFEDQGEFDTVRDFRIGQDTVHIVDGASSFDDLTLYARGASTFIEFGDSKFRLINVETDDLTAADFLFGAIA